MPVQLQGIEQLIALSRQFKLTGDKVAQASMRARLRAVVAPVVADVKRAATRADIPHEIPGTVRAVFRYTPRSAGVTIKADRARMPDPQAGLPMLFELGNRGRGGHFLRHPVFGRAVFVDQPIHPYFYDTIDKHKARVEAEMNAVLADVEASLLL